MMEGMFALVTPSPAEIAAPRPGDGLVPGANVTMDRAFSVPGAPAVVWPWIVQLGKDRAGWYFPRGVERFIPPSRRAIRVIDARWQALAPGDVIPDWGGKNANFVAVAVDAPASLVYRSERGNTALSWAITLTADGSGSTRVHLRLRLGSVKRVRLAETVGGAFDAATILGMAAGLRERLTS